MNYPKIINILKENWNIMPKYQKVQLLEILHQHYSLRQIAKLLGKGAKTIHWYLKYEVKDSTSFLSKIDTLLSYADPVVYSVASDHHLPSGDEAKTRAR